MDSINTVGGAMRWLACHLIHRHYFWKWYIQRHDDAQPFCTHCERWV